MIMKKHILKTDPKTFQASWDDQKPYEIRLDDRNFQVGDELLLVETVHSGEEMKSGAPLEYTGRCVMQDVVHKLKGEYGIMPGWCILGVSNVMWQDDYDPDEPDWQTVWPQATRMEWWKRPGKSETP